MGRVGGGVGPTGRFSVRAGQFDYMSVPEGLSWGLFDLGPHLGGMGMGMERRVDGKDERVGNGGDLGRLSACVSV